MADAAAESKDAKTPPPAASGLSMKLVIVIAVGALVLGLGGAGAFFMLKGDGRSGQAAGPSEHGDAHASTKESGEHGDHGKTPGTIMELDPFIVNLADAPEVRYLKLAVKVELDRPDASGELTARLPQVRDTVLMLLSGKESTQLRTTQGKTQLRDELVQRINAVTTRGGVRTVYCTEFVVQ
jgi:flagellar FliL protein